MTAAPPDAVQQPRWLLSDADWNSWPGGLTDAQTFAQAAGLGLAGIELGVYDPDVELAPSRLAALSELSRETGVVVSGVLLSLPPERWPDGALCGDVDRLAASVAACARVCHNLGLPVLGLWPGEPAGGDPVPALRRVVEAAGDVRVALEYKPGTVVPDAAAAQRLCEQVDGLGVLLDTGHAFAAGEDPAEVVRALGSLLLHCHLGDAAPGGGDDDLPCGRLHDFTAFCRALDDTGFAGTASFDLYGVASGGLPAAEAVGESLAHVLSARG
jgi:sugar phosphate isomerase/epimerase